MARRKKTRPLPDGWVRREEFSWNGRNIVPGTELSIKGERASRFRFVSHTVTPTSEWIDVIGGTKGVAQWRSFSPERIKTVHRKRRTLTTREARELMKEKRLAKRADRSH